MDGKLRALAASRVTSGCTRAEARALARLADLVEVAPLRPLAIPGTRRTGCFLLLDGTVATEGGGEVWLTSYAGSFVGLAETVADVANAQASVAMSPVRALVFTPGALAAAVDAVEPLRRAVVRQLAAAALSTRPDPRPVGVQGSHDPSER